MNDAERRAKWLATWASMGFEAAAFLRDRGQESDGADLERAVCKVLDLVEDEIGEDVIRAAIQEINDLWCHGQSLADDYFADAWKPPLLRVVPGAADVDK